MEYFLGSLITILCIFLLNKTIEKRIDSHVPIPIFSQSRKYDVLQSYLRYKKQNSKPKQSLKNLKSGSARGMVFGNSVYWIENGFLFTANYINGKIDENSKKRVDTYSMSNVELKRIAFIVEKLTEGRSDDTGNTGNKNF